MNSNGTRHRSWVFTTNNPTETDIIPEDIAAHSIRYAIYQLEQGREGTPHFQGVVNLVNARSLLGIKKELFFIKSHLEPCIDLQASIKYCSKDEGRLAGPWELGIRPEPGKRNDLSKIVEEVHEGSGKREILETFPVVASRSMRYLEGLISYQLSDVALSYRQFICPPGSDVSPRKRVYYLEGSTGSGKSRTTFPLVEKKVLYRLSRGTGSPGSIWFDHYNGEPGLWIDELAPDDVKVELLLQLTDIYPMLVQIKGNFVDVCFTYVVITSNYGPKQLVGGKHQAAWLRRITDHQTSNYDLSQAPIPEWFEPGKLKVNLVSSDGVQNDLSPCPLSVSLSLGPEDTPTVQEPDNVVVGSVLVVGGVSQESVASEPVLDVVLSPGKDF